MPTGEIAVGEYDYHTAALPVIAYNIANDDSIAAVTAVIWHNEDQSDLQWVELPQNEDGTYSTNVNIANFNFVLRVSYTCICCKHRWTAVCPRRRNGKCAIKDEKYKTLFRLDFLEIYFSWNYKHTCGDNSNVRSI